MEVADAAILQTAFQRSVKRLATRLQEAAEFNRFRFFSQPRRGP